MDNRSIKRVIDHISPETTDLLITGGEPLSVRSSLEHALSYLKQRREQVLPQGNVCVETNGFWVEDKESAYRTLKELYELKVDTVAFASLDKFHREQGLDTDKLEFRGGGALSEAMEQLANEGMVIGVKRKGTNYGVVPFGRARELPPEEYIDRTVCMVPWNFRKNSREVTIAPDGQAYLCCFKVISSSESAIDTPIDEIVERARQDPVMLALMEGGLKEAAIKKGVFRPEDSWIYENTPCAQCKNIFRDSSTTLENLDLE